MKKLFFISFFIIFAVAACKDSKENDYVDDVGITDEDTADYDSYKESEDSDDFHDGNYFDSEDSDEISDKDIHEADEEENEVVCEYISIDSDKLCEIQENGDALLIKGRILAHDREYIGGQVLINEEGLIVCHGCDCLEKAEEMAATEMTCPDGVVSPALINAHDHMGWTHNSPSDWGQERFEHRHDWRKGLHGHSKISAPGGASKENKQWGELRNVMAGTTTIAGSGGAEGFLRNVDRNMYLEGLNKGDVDYSTFPLGDSDGTQLDGSCDYSDYMDGEEKLHHDCYLPHVAEGINNYARNEFLCLSSDSYDEKSVDLTKEKSAFIHGVALNAKDGEKLASSGTSIIWSPRTNISLYGNTAPVTMLHKQGVLLGMGTDWTPSGSINMLRELACALYLNETHFNTYFSSKDLWLMATMHNATALRMSEVVGAIQNGLTADIAVFDGREQHDSYAAVIDSHVSLVALVLRGGLPLYGDSNVFPALRDTQECEKLDVCGREKTVCVKRETGISFEELAEKNSWAYDLFFCEEPEGEPSCIPMRTPGDDTNSYDGIPTVDDRDGDGIPDHEDSCPDVFNPIRPMDGGVQADTDGDGIGDVCDFCPLSPHSETCSVPDRNDGDGDDIPNFEDNCPFVFNPDQADQDNDGIGDACDFCPDFPNPGYGSCPATIYDIKKGDIKPGASVSGVTGIVTAVSDSGFYMQVAKASEQWDEILEHEYSGIFVYIDELVIPGNVVSVDGKVEIFYDLIEIKDIVAFHIIDDSEMPPSPVYVKPSEINTEGKFSEKYNSVLVSVKRVEVTDDSLGYNEFLVTGDLRVDDEIYSYGTPPEKETRFRKLTGILGYSFSNSKLWPRREEDMVED